MPHWIQFTLKTTAFGLLFFPEIGLTQEQDFEKSFGDLEKITDYVSIATGYRQSVQTAPAVTSVVTAQQIRDRGARTIVEILEFIPGFFMGRTAHSIEPIVAVRGFTSPYNQTLLVMLDGIPQTESVFGDRLAMLGLVPLDIIDRVEIMRGPGSALYGADAYSAVVNIITRRTPPEQTQITLGAGSQQTRNARLLGGGSVSETRIVGAVEYRETDGDAPWIAADVQTNLDAWMGTHASLAPSRANTSIGQLGAHLNVTGQNMSLMLRTALSRDQGMGVGLAGALDPFGQIDATTVEGQLETHTQGPDWKATGTLNGTLFQYRLNNVHYFPPGAFGGFPDGVIANTDFEEHRLRLQGRLEYTGLATHHLAIGAGVETGRTRLRSESRNYRLSEGLPIPIGPVQDTRDDPSLGAVAYTHDLQFIDVQDAWTLHPDWTLTAGVRYDHYTDFGDLVNPRMALVWDTSAYLTSKLLYGRGFRGPSLLDAEARQIPALLGNPDLKPETLDSLELAFDYRPRADVWARLNLYYQQTEDQIRVQDTEGPSSQPENVGQQKGHGAELELEWDLDRRTQLYGAYAYQDNTDETTGQDAGYTPHHLWLARLQHRRPPWLFSIQGRYVGRRDRIAEDPRPSADTYGILDTLVRYESTHGWSADFEVRNFFDTEADEAGFGTAFPGDLPIPGRTFFFYVTTQF